MTRFELVTSSLPRKRSTDWATWALFRFQIVFARRPCEPQNKAWSGRRGSNSRHSAWKAEALPTELLPLINPFIGLPSWGPAFTQIIAARENEQWFQWKPCSSNRLRKRTSPTSTLSTRMVVGGGFEPPKASPTDLQSVPFGRSGTPPRASHGASGGTRTPDPLITNQ